MENTFLYLFMYFESVILCDLRSRVNLKNIHFPLLLYHRIINLEHSFFIFSLIHRLSAVPRGFCFLIPRCSRIFAKIGREKRSC